MKKKIKVLLVAPYSKEKVGGIGTWTKLILDYSESVDDVELLFQNTVHTLPKRWSMNNRLAHFFVGSIDSLLILLKLFYNLCFKKPEVVHYTSSAANALYKDRIAAFISNKLFKTTFVIHWRFGRIPAIFIDRGREYKRFIKVLDLVSVSIVLDSASDLVLKNEGYKVELIPNPISQTIHTIAKKNVKGDLQIKRNHGTVLFVGHMLDTKGVFEIVKACAICKQVKKLIMVGPFFDETVKEKLIELSKERDNGNWLFLLGEKPREQVWEYYKTCSLFCLPSYTEGFPNVILEAMAFACPIVATKVGAIPEMLSDGCGELIDAHRVEPLVEAINNLLVNLELADKMGERARLKVLNSYSIDTIFDRYYKVWNNNTLWD